MQLCNWNYRNVFQLCTMCGLHKTPIQEHSQEQNNFWLQVCSFSSYFVCEMCKNHPV